MFWHQLPLIVGGDGSGDGGNVFVYGVEMRVLLY